MTKRVSILMLTAWMIMIFMLLAPAVRATSTETEYAWVQVEIHDYENADKWAAADAHASYKVSYSYSRGTYSASVTYEGDDPYKEGIKGTLGLQAVYSGVPHIIYPDQPVSISLSFTTTQNDTVKLSFTGSAAADFDQWDVAPGGVTGRAQYFANADGKDSFTLDVNGNPSSYGETLTATLGAGSKGSRIALRTRFALSGVPMGTNYVYEWKQVGEAAEQPTPTARPTSKPLTPSVEERPNPATGKVETTICKIGGLHGEVDVRPNDEDDDAYIFAWSGMALYHNDRVKTLTRSGCIISFSDMSTYVMKEDSTIVLDIANEKTSKIGLVAGNVWINLKKMIEGGSMEVEMGQAIAGARGTTFICEEIGGTSVLKVIEGTVAYTSKISDESVLVKGGQMVVADRNGLGELTSFDIDTELASWDENTQALTKEALKNSKGGLNAVVVILIGMAVIVLAAVLVVVLLRRKKTAPPLSPAYPPTQASQASAQFCVHCGSPISPGSQFCEKCGQRIQ